ncbi:acetoin reductase family protein [Cyathus striatus]|nr:acetoin reductase family protein [Cyathus striatus]
MSLPNIARRSTRSLRPLLPLSSYTTRSQPHFTSPSLKFSTSAISNEGVALVTGASRGIGRAIALRLAQDGFDISLNDLTYSKDGLKEVESEISKIGRKSTVVLGDVSKEEDVKGIVDGTVASMGGVDVMVANAGICISMPLTEMTTDDLDRLYSINIRGVFLCYKYAALQMIKQGRGGRLIGASSVAGKKGYVNMSGYSTSKFAVRGMTQSAAGELGKYGITVNAYSPGAIDTIMLRELGDSLLGDYGEFYNQQEQLAPVGRIGTAEDTANLVSFLASSKSGFITGQSVSVNGGTYFD